MAESSAMSYALWRGINSLNSHYNPNTRQVNLKPEEIKQHAGAAYENLSKAMKHLNALDDKVLDDRAIDNRVIAEKVYGVAKKVYENPEYSPHPVELQDISLFLRYFGSIMGSVR